MLPPLYRDESLYHSHFSKITEKLKESFTILLIESKSMDLIGRDFINRDNLDHGP